jgi:hypothetical protein
MRRIGIAAERAIRERAIDAAAPHHRWWCADAPPFVTGVEPTTWT